MDKNYNRNNIFNILNHWQNFRLKIIFQGIIVGILSGLLIVFYRIVLEKAEELRSFIFNQNISMYKLIPIWFVVLIISAYIVGMLIKNEPLISGSGIPQVEGMLIGKIKANWLSIIIKKFIGGVICIGAGLSLGREGPSIQLGASVGQGISQLLKRLKIEEKYLITSGASAGLAAAFNAPLAGVMFALEEVHKHFSPLILLPAMAASLTADFISKYFFGLKPVFNFHNVTAISLDKYGYIILLGVVVGVFGAFYNYTLLKAQDLYKQLKWLPVKFRPMLPFIAAGFLIIFLPQVLGGGHSLIDSLINSNYTLKMLLIILIFKYFFSLLSYGSGAPGGIFFPLLVLGALTGAIYGNLIVKFTGMDYKFINNFIMLAMAGYFTAIVRAPITGSILITEMTGSFSNLLSLSVVSLVAYSVAYILESEPIYESLLERLLRNNGQFKFHGNSNNKSILEIPVYLASFMDGKKIKQLSLPNDCLLVGIRRGEKELIPKGNTTIHSGDCLIVLVNEDNAALTNEELLEMSRSI